MKPVRFEYVSKVDNYKDWYMVHDAGEKTDCLVYLHGHGSNGDQFLYGAILNQGWIWLKNSI